MFVDRPAEKRVPVGLIVSTRTGLARAVHVNYSTPQLMNGRMAGISVGVLQFLFLRIRCDVMHIRKEDSDSKNPFDSLHSLSTPQKRNTIRRVVVVIAAIRRQAHFKSNNGKILSM